MPTHSIFQDNVASLMEQALPKSSLNLLKKIGDFGRRQSLPIFLVGGPLRDLLLNRPLKDIDLLVEGDSVAFASHLAKQFKGSLVATSQFGTAKIKIGSVTIDLATARKETYARPGALPTVSPGTVGDDLIRRDFSINAMAASLSPSTWGKLLDPYGGRKDLAAGLVRVLHSKSFRDDATRILRAIRYEQRLGLRIEPRTRALLQSSLKYLDAISGDRIRHEFDHIFHEEKALKMLDRAKRLGVLSAISPGLERAPSFRSIAGNRVIEAKDNSLVYLALLVYPLSEDEAEAFIKRLNMPSRWAKISRDASVMRTLSKELRASNQTPSQIYELLHGIAPEALQACKSVTKSKIVRARIGLYLTKLQFVKPSLDGEQLLNIGVPQGPMVGNILDDLKRARLNGEVATQRQEEQLARRLLKACKSKPIKKTARRGVAR